MSRACQIRIGNQKVMSLFALFIKLDGKRSANRSMIHVCKCNFSKETKQIKFVDSIRKMLSIG